MRQMRRTDEECGVEGDGEGDVGEGEIGGEAEEGGGGGGSDPGAAGRAVAEARREREEIGGGGSDGRGKGDEACETDLPLVSHCVGRHHRQSSRHFLNFPFCSFLFS